MTTIINFWQAFLSLRFIIHIPSSVMQRVKFILDWSILQWNTVDWVKESFLPSVGFRSILAETSPTSLPSDYVICG